MSSGITKEGQKLVGILVKKLVKSEIKDNLENIRKQVSTLQGSNRSLLRHQGIISEMHRDFVKAIPEAFKYMHQTYGQNNKFSPETYSKMAMNIIKFKMLKFEEG